MDDKEFRGHVDKAGGLLSMIGIAYDVCEKIHNGLKTQKEKAYNSLSKFVLKSTKDFLKDLEKEDGFNPSNKCSQIRLYQSDTKNKRRNF